LYDTFHEPFKRVVSSRPAVSETPVQDNAEPRSVSVEKEEDNATENANKGKNKEPELTVKSALSAAFARYADKVGKKNT
jgi:DNA excision repair protein ERCC-1